MNVFANEAAYQRAFIDTLEARRVIVKVFHDEVSTGVPDLYLANKIKRTGLWMEVKWLPKFVPDRAPFYKPDYWTKKQEKWLTEVNGVLLVGTPDYNFVFSPMTFAALRSSTMFKFPHFALVSGKDLVDLAARIKASLLLDGFGP